MSYKDFWDNPDTKMYKYLMDAFHEKNRFQRNYDNQVAWLSGLYVRNAVGSFFNQTDYPVAIDFEDYEKEAERKSKMTEEELIAEEQRKVVEQSKINAQIAMAKIKRMKESK